MKPYTLHHGGALYVLPTLDAGSVDTCVTSPPYFGLRDYGAEGQIGLEPTVEAYVEKLVAVFREVRRVLRDDGTLWLNLGDSYAGSGRGGYPGATGSLTGGNADGQDESRKAKAAQASRGSPRERLANGRGDQPAVLRKKREVSPPRIGGSVLPAGLHENASQAGAVGRGCPPPPDGLKSKDLIGVPWRVAFALQADGWWLRSDIIWHKPNPMPSSVTDRPTSSHEYLFLLAKSRVYHYDADAIREHATRDRSGNVERLVATAGERQRTNTHLGSSVPWENDGTGRNRRDVWTIPPEPYAGAHFAVMPTALVKPCVLAGCRPGGLVLDPFAGSGTVGKVAI